MKYKVTRKAIFCGLMDCHGHSIPECLKCRDCEMVLDITEDYTQKQYLDLLDRGNVFITKVETEP